MIAVSVSFVLFDTSPVNTTVWGSLTLITLGWYGFPRCPIFFYTVNGNPPLCRNCPAPERQVCHAVAPTRTLRPRLIRVLCFCEWQNCMPKRCPKVPVAGNSCRPMVNPSAKSAMGETLF